MWCFGDQSNLEQDRKYVRRMKSHVVLDLADFAVIPCSLFREIYSFIRIEHPTPSQRDIEKEYRAYSTVPGG